MICLIYVIFFNYITICGSHNGRQGTIHAKVVVNATGLWTDTIRAFAGENKKILCPTRGIHLVVVREKLNIHHIIVLSTKKVPLCGGNIYDFENYTASELKGLGDHWGLPPKIIERLLNHYDTDYLKILSPGLLNQKYLQPLSTNNEVLKGEVVYSFENEMASTLKYFMERRTNPKHYDPNRGLNVAEEVANVMDL